MATLLSIAQLVETLLPQALSLITQAIAAVQTNDQATLDSLHAQAVAAAEALKPAGAV
jgi:hypothetical protein